MTLNEFKKLKPGSKVQLNKQILEFYKTWAWNGCQVGGVLKETYINDYFLMRAISLGIPYKAKLIEFLKQPVNEHNDIGAKVQYEIAGLKGSSIYSYKDLKKVTK